MTNHSKLSRVDEELTVLAEQASKSLGLSTDHPGQEEKSAEEMPMTIVNIDNEAEDNTNEDGELKDMLLLYNKHCNRCAFLVAHETDFDTANELGCHYLDGNNECPARVNRLVVGVDFEKASSALCEAWVQNDVVRIHKIMRKLSKLDTAVSKLVMDMAHAKIKKTEQTN